jgi:hypothetical protein
MLAESEILNPAGELGLLIDQPRGGTLRAAAENSGAKSYRHLNQSHPVRGIGGWTIPVAMHHGLRNNYVLRSNDTFTS